MITRGANSSTNAGSRVRETASISEDLSLADQLHDLLVLPEAALEHAMAARVLRENALDDDARHRATHERLCAWLELEPEDARIIARAFEHAVARLDSAVRERRLETERAVILNAMSMRQVRALAPLVEWLRCPPFNAEDIFACETPTTA